GKRGRLLAHDVAGDAAAAAGSVEGELAALLRVALDGGCVVRSRLSRRRAVEIRDVAVRAPVGLRPAAALRIDPIAMPGPGRGGLLRLERCRLAGTGAGLRGLRRNGQCRARCEYAERDAGAERRARGGVHVSSWL